jgi:hypothetical protein
VCCCYCLPFGRPGFSRILYRPRKPQKSQRPWGNSQDSAFLVSMPHKRYVHSVGNESLSTLFQAAFYIACKMAEHEPISLVSLLLRGFDGASDHPKPYPVAAPRMSHRPPRMQSSVLTTTTIQQKERRQRFIREE